MRTMVLGLALLAATPAWADEDPEAAVQEFGQGLDQAIAKYKAGIDEVRAEMQKLQAMLQK